MSDPDDDPRETFAQALRRSSLGRVAPGQTPSGGALLAAMGGVLGIVESVLPGLLFLVVYTITQNLWWSVAAPAVIAVVFIVVRAVRRQPVTTAIAGLLGIVISAVIALLTGKAVNNFVPGFAIDGGIFLVMVVSLIVRRPFLGVLVGFLIGDREWRKDRAQFRVAFIATILWALLGGLRLAVQLPFYALGNTQALAATHLIMGVPLYAIVLWLTWLLFRTAWTMPEREDESDDKRSGEQ